MNYLSAENLAKSFDERWLFQQLSIGINKGQKVALVGANGCGKTTLFKILAGKMPSDGGTVVVNKGIRSAYLDQNPEFDPNLKVVECLFTGDTAILKAIQHYEECLAHPENTDELQKAMEMMDDLKAWDYEQKVKQIVSKLGVIDFEQKVGTLSGGQKKRLALAQILIEEPDLLLLDEPTNHLDIETIEWLEHILSSSQSTLLLITHDRYFLDQVCNEIIEIDNGQLHRYRGNYSYYLERKAEREQQDAASVDKARNLLKKELEWMRRQPKARGTKAKYRVDAFYDLKDKAQSKKQDDKLELSLLATRQGNKVLELHHVGMAFGNKTLLKDFSYIFKKKDRIGIVGKNGIGKSTLLNLLTNQMTPQQGEIIKGETTQLGYYTQTGLQLKEDMRVIDTVKDVAEVIKLADGSVITASQLLQLFLFPPNKQYTFVSKLSGGEKKRLMLLQILIKNPNFLILDEPTNDLDIVTLNVLEDFLEKFPGCLIIVSHDRYFMDRLVDHLFVFEGEGDVKDFPGNYTDYREWQKEQETVKEKPEAVVTAPVIQENSGSEKKKLSFKERKEYEDLEKEIQKLENEKAGLMENMNQGETDHAKLSQWSQRIQEIEAALDVKSMRWLELSERD